LKTVEDISELSKSFLDCRDRGHAWYDAKSEPSLKRTNIGLVIRILICNRCHTRREDWIVSASGAIDGRRYVYPDGYLMKSGTERIARQDVRKLAVRAAFATLRQRRSA
jgi:hypothetical protein